MTVGSSEEENTRKDTEISLETFRGNLDSVRELTEIGFLEPGTRIGLGVLIENSAPDLPVWEVEDSEAWIFLSDREKRGFLRNVGIHLGVDMEQLTSERAIRTYKEGGIRGAPSEGGADVMVFNTKFPVLELHVMDYGNSDIGRRYDLVVASK